VHHTFNGVVQTSKEIVIHKMEKIVALYGTRKLDFRTYIES
jgi:hypothetical protein